MKEISSVSSGQLFAMLFVSRMVVSMTYGTLLIGDSELWDHLVSVPIAFILTFLLMIPIYKLFKMNTKMSLIDNLEIHLGKFGIAITALYIIYYLVISFHTLAIFNNFILNSVNPSISLPILSVLLLLSACYGAYKGLEALVRTSGFILLATVLAFLFLGVSLFSSIEKINFTPLLYNGTQSFWEGVLYMISQASCIPALAVLLPMSKGNHKKAMIFWNTGIYAIFALIIVLITGTMGDFGKTQLFPVYTAAGIGKFGAFRHLDSLYLGIWMSGIFLKLSLFLFLAGEGVKKIKGEKMGKYSVVVFGFFMAIFPFFYGDFKILYKSFLTYFLIVYLLIIAVVIPLVLIIFKNKKPKKEKIKIEN